jgi:hypothetical protein
VPIDARGVDDGTALHYAGMWGHAGTLKLLLDRGSEIDLPAGDDPTRGTALAWTAWGSRWIPHSAERVDDYLAAATVLLDAGAQVTEGMIEVAADEVAVLLEERR